MPRAITLKPGQVTEIPLGRLVPDPDQPRKTFDEAGLQQLAASLKKRVLVPLLVHPDTGGKFRIHDGERRYRAAKLAKLKRLPVLLYELYEDATANQRSAQLAVNNLREQLTTMDVARSLAELRRSSFATDNELAAHLEREGLPPMTPKQIRDAIALVDLPDWAQAMIDAGEMEPGSASPIKLAMPYPKVLEAVQKGLRQEFSWGGKLTANDVVRGVQGAFDDHGADLNRTEHWHVYSGAVHFNPKTVCKGCEHLVNVGGQKYCMNPPEFERKNEEAKAAGLLPGGKKPQKDQPKPEEVSAEKKEERRALTMGEKARDYLHAYLVRRIVEQMKPEASSQIDITDELLAWHAMGRPGQYNARRAGLAPYEARKEVGVRGLEALFAATDLEPARLHAAIEVAHGLCWRETQVICHQLWGAAIENVWRLDEAFVNLFRKAELLHLVEQHGLELDEGLDWNKLKVAELKKEILARADQVQRPQILQDLYDEVAEPWVSWAERESCEHGVGPMDYCEECEDAWEAEEEDEAA